MGDRCDRGRREAEAHGRYPRRIPSHGHPEDVSERDDGGGNLRQRGNAERRARLCAPVHALFGRAGRLHAVLEAGAGEEHARPSACSPLRLHERLAVPVLVFATGPDRRERPRARLLARDPLRVRRDAVPSGEDRRICRCREAGWREVVRRRHQRAFTVQILHSARLRRERRPRRAHLQGRRSRHHGGAGQSRRFCTAHEIRRCAFRRYRRPRRVCADRGEGKALAGGVGRFAAGYGAGLRKQRAGSVRAARLRTSVPRFALADATSSGEGIAPRLRRADERVVAGRQGGGVLAAPRAGDGRDSQLRDLPLRVRSAGHGDPGGASVSPESQVEAVWNAC